MQNEVMKPRFIFGLSIVAVLGLIFGVAAWYKVVFLKSRVDEVEAKVADYSEQTQARLESLDLTTHNILRSVDTMYLMVRKTGTAVDRNQHSIERNQKAIERLKATKANKGE